MIGERQRLKKRGCNASWVKRGTIIVQHARKRVLASAHTATNNVGHFIDSDLYALLR
jgi:hypothetical protein